MSEAFSNLIRPIIERYLAHYDEFSEDLNSISFIGGTLSRSLGPLPIGEEFGGFNLTLNDDGTVTTIIQVQHYVPHHFTPNEGIDYFITNPILQRLFPNEYPYEEHPTEDEASLVGQWIDLDLTPYFPLRLVAIIPNRMRGAFRE